MPKFVYNSAKNVNTGYTFYKLKCGYYLHVFYKKNFNFCLKAKTAKNLFYKV